MSKIGNEEFIERLRKAKKLALTKYKATGRFRINSACRDVEIRWPYSASFGMGTPWQNFSSHWLNEVGNTDENVARVFDESIKALGGTP